MNIETRYLRNPDELFQLLDDTWLTGHQTQKEAIQLPYEFPCVAAFLVTEKELHIDYVYLSHFHIFNMGALDEPSYMKIGD